MLVLLVMAQGAAADEQPVDFNRDIRPLFAAKCFACHGPDEDHREADLRLDERETAVGSGAIEPGKPDQSDLMRRILSEDPDERMPPQSNDSLSDAQKEIFQRWIKEGARYEPHWSFVPPQKPPIPQVEHADWPRNQIDYFVLARLEAAGLEPSAEADRFALVRRVYLDLIGLPPTPEEADAFVNDEDPQAYEKLVDKLLKSEHYGERWARQWLDLARYADTNGYEKDRERSIWPYRDWVIRALNDDMPFDQFTIEQLAGDMLPDATQEQIIATGFHRNTMLNEEGGIDPLEYRFYAMVDRVATTGTVWLGLSNGCAQCHTHKYDPITHSDYYRFMALLNNADEPDRLVKSPDIVERRRHLEDQIRLLEADLPNQFPPVDGDESIEQRRQQNLEAKFQAWLKSARDAAQDWQTLVPTSLESNLPRLEVLDDDSIFSSGDITKRDVFQLSFSLDASMLPITAIRLEVLPDERLPAGGPGRAYYEGRKGDFFLSELKASLDDTPIQFASASQSYGKISVGSGNANAENVFDGNGSTGWSTADREGQPHQLVLNLAKPIAESGVLQIELLFERHFAASLGRFRFSAVSAEKPAIATAFPDEIERLIVQPLEELSEAKQLQLTRHYLQVAPELGDARKQIEKMREQIPPFPNTMVMEERPADNLRKTFRHHRGEYLDPKEEVAPGIPAFLLNDSQQSPQDRLALARWLVSESNPLIGRVTVNRAWQALFGVGLHRTSDDFGTQAQSPSHPQLLDSLACVFVEQGWSLKQLHRLIVTSATYRQSSQLSPALLKRDPQNELLARGPRLRVDAEMVRDIMLHSSGLLSRKMYGPSVRPPQPQSVTAVAYGSPPWIPSAGEDRYRRSLYTFSQRTAPFAAFVVFDAPTGENCIARRDRSNTPLQALTLLNDEMYLEMSRGLASLAMSKELSDQETARFIFRRLMTRPPHAEEETVIVNYQRSQLKRLEAGELRASEIFSSEAATNQQAAWALVARSLMNLDEAITKP
jgi:hypothetical protein